jgi:hypothetical protein
MTPKRFLLFIGTIIALASCQKEADVSPASGTFIRYFGSENNNDAVLAIESDNGYMLLSNVEIPWSTTSTQRKLRLTKVDVNGEYLWERTFPEFVNDEIESEGMRGASVSYLPGSGYIVVGDWIKGNTTELLVLRTDLEGNLTDSVTISRTDIADAFGDYSTANLSGRAIIQADENGQPSIIALGKVNNALNDMIVVSLRSADLSMQWNRKYRGNARNEVVNRMFAINSQLFWSATVGVGSDKRDVRIVEAPMNAESTVQADPNLVTGTISESATDFCRTISGWAIIGTSDAFGDNDIFLLRTTTNGIETYKRYNVAYNNIDVSVGAPELDTDNYPTNEGIDNPKLNDEGKSITTDNDGNLLLAGTLETSTNGKEIFLMKLNAVTNQGMWRKTFGGGDTDEAASVRALRDGYLLFGTTHFGRSRKLVLMKLNQNGEL